MQKKPVILINGTGGCGKDSFIEFCNELVPCYNVSTVDRVKEAAQLLGWDGAKTDRDRKFLSDIKSLSVLYSDHPYCYITEQIEWFQQDTFHKLMFFHSREPVEIKRFEKLGCITLLVLNDNVEIIKSNASDGNVLDFPYEYFINNSGSLEELRDKAHDFVSKILRAES